jgi:hypothetical protein
MKDGAAAGDRFRQPATVRGVKSLGESLSSEREQSIRNAEVRQSMENS